MAYELGQAVKATFVAAEQLDQYTFVQFYANGSLITDQVTKAINDDAIIGVVQNSPKAGEEAEVVLVGITKVKSAGYISVGARIKNSNGQAKPETGSAWIVGRALSEANAGEIATIAISTPSYNYFVD